MQQWLHMYIVNMLVSVYLHPLCPSPSQGLPSWSFFGWSVYLSLFWHSLTAHSVLPLPTFSLQYTLALLMHITCLPPTPTPSILPLHTLQQLISSHSCHVSKPSQGTTLHHSTISYHTCPKPLLYFHYFLHPILIEHMHLFCNSFSLHIFSMPVLHSMSITL